MHLQLKRHAHILPDYFGIGLDDIDIIDATWCFAGPGKPIPTNVARRKAYMKFASESEDEKIQLHDKSKEKKTPYI